MRWTKEAKKTTYSWKLLIKYKDESETWIPLKNLKESCLIKSAKYAKSRGINDEHMFVCYTLRKRDVILSSVRKQITKQAHKYGTEIPTNTSYASRVDSMNKNTFWRDIIDLEIRNNRVSFEILDEENQAPPG